MLGFGRQTPYLFTLEKWISNHYIIDKKKTLDNIWHYLVSYILKEGLIAVLAS